MIYLMSDVHGQGDAFFTLLEKIRFSGDDRLIIVGDLIAKGKDSLSLLRFSMQHENILLLKGNHEARLLYACGALEKALEPREVIRNWMDGEGAQLLRELRHISIAEYGAILQYLLAAPVTKELEAFGTSWFCVHGAPKGTREESLLTGRYKDLQENNHCPGKTVVVGHTPTFRYGEAYRGKIIRMPDKILLDCGAGHGGPLGCFRLEDEACFYSECT